MPKKIFDSEELLPCEPVSVKLKLSPNLAYRVYDEFTDPEILADGSFIVSTTFPHGEWLYQYLISFGEQAEVLEPTDIRNKLKEKLGEMINIYF
jgi:predicted DNA-binding transcriptional regulator YafY